MSTEAARPLASDRLPEAPVGRMGGLFLFLLPLLLVVPFDPFWPDFERARRALLLVFTGLYLVASLRERNQGPSRLFAPLLALPVLSLLSGIWAWDFLACFESGSYYLALALLPVLVPQGRAALRPLGRGVCLALLLTSMYGIAQHLGFDWPAGFTSPDEAVSTLGNRNVAAEWTTMAAPLAFFAGLIPGAFTLLFAEIYLWFNGGRAALVGFHLFLLFLIWKPWALGLEKGARRLLMALLAVSLLLGAWTLRDRLFPARTPTAATAAQGPFVRAGNTLAVRLLIYRRALDMGMDALPLGVGGGNFRVRFPRYRSPEEIQISSLDGRLVTRVTTAHNDPLQIFTELGIAGLFFLLLFFYLLVKELRTHGIGALAIASLLAFLPLVLTRAPLGNASAALCFLLAIQLSQRTEATRPWCRFPRGILPLLGLLLLYPGMTALLGELQAAGFVRAQNLAKKTAERENTFPSRLLAVRETISAAIQCDPLEPDWRLMRAQVYHRNRLHFAKNPRLPRRSANESHPRFWNKLAIWDLSEVLSRRPYEYQALAEVGWIGLGDYRWPPTKFWSEIRKRGQKAVSHLLQVYPGHPEGLRIQQGYRRLDKALAGLGRKVRPGTRPFLEGHAACLAILQEDPMHYTALYFAIHYALKTGQFQTALEKLEKLRSKKVLLEVLSEVERRRTQAKGAAILQLLKLKQELMNLGRKLFPDSAEFRQD